jgi:hypothetical protein
MKGICTLDKNLTDVNPIIATLTINGEAATINQGINGFANNFGHISLMNSQTPKLIVSSESELGR